MDPSRNVRRPGTRIGGDPNQAEALAALGTIGRFGGPAFHPGLAAALDGAAPRLPEAFMGLAVAPPPQPSPLSVFPPESWMLSDRELGEELGLSDKELAAIAGPTFHGLPVQHVDELEHQPPAHVFGATAEELAETPRLADALEAAMSSPSRFAEMVRDRRDHVWDGVEEAVARAEAEGMPPPADAPYAIAPFRSDLLQPPAMDRRPRLNSRVLYVLPRGSYWEGQVRAAVVAEVEEGAGGPPRCNLSVLKARTNDFLLRPTVGDQAARAPVPCGVLDTATGYRTPPRLEGCVAGWGTESPAALVHGAAYDAAGRPGTWHWPDEPSNN